MVANNFLGRSNSLEIMWKTLEFSSSPCSMSERVNEKKATSAPEINAEQINRIMSRIISDTSDELVVDNNKIKLEGSGSKVKGFS